MLAARSVHAQRLESNHWLTESRASKPDGEPRLPINGIADTGASATNAKSAAPEPPAAGAGPLAQARRDRPGTLAHPSASIGRGRAAVEMRGTWDAFEMAGAWLG